MKRRVERLHNTRQYAENPESVDVKREDPGAVVVERDDAEVPAEK